MLWEEMTSEDFKSSIEKCSELCVVPIGVLEKHGDHLPLGTDMFIVNEVAKAAVHDSPAVLFPYYFLGQISEARHVPGTIAPSHKLIMDAILEMCDEIHRNGFKKILLMSGHGGNWHFLPFFAQMFPGIKRDYAVYVNFVHYMTEEQLKKIQTHSGIEDMGGHAGFSETSLIMYLRPELVHFDRVKVEESESLDRLKNITEKGIYTGFNWYANYPHHFAGDPFASSQENGKLIFDILVKNSIDVLNAIKADDVLPGLVKEYNNRTL